MQSPPLPNYPSSFQQGNQQQRGRYGSQGVNRNQGSQQQTQFRGNNNPFQKQRNDSQQNQSQNRQGQQQQNQRSQDNFKPRYDQRTSSTPNNGGNKNYNNNTKVNNQKYNNNNQNVSKGYQDRKGQQYQQQGQRRYNNNNNNNNNYNSNNNNNGRTQNLNNKWQKNPQQFRGQFSDNEDGNKPKRVFNNDKRNNKFQQPFQNRNNNSRKENNQNQSDQIEEEYSDHSENYQAGSDQENDNSPQVEIKPVRQLQIKRVAKAEPVQEDDNQDQEENDDEAYEEGNSQDRQEEDDQDQDGNDRDEDDYNSDNADDQEGYDDNENNNEDYSNNQDDEDQDNQDYDQNDQEDEIDEQQDNDNKEELNQFLGKSMNQIESTQADLLDQQKKLKEMCHEMVNDEQYEQHMDHGKLNFIFFERDASGKPVKSKAMKAYYRSAAGNELEMKNILSPLAIKKSAERMISEILDYFLNPKIKVKELVNGITDRIRTLVNEFEPLSKHLSLFEGSKLMIEPKEKVLIVHLAGINYFRKESCLKNSEDENGYNEKKHFEALQTQVDSLFNIYEMNVEKVCRIIKSNKQMSEVDLKQKILNDSNIYISPLIPKVVAWRMLITLNQKSSLHKMDNFLTLTLDSLDRDPAFSAVYDMILWLSSRNYFKYFEQLATDERLDYLTANAALLHLTEVRLQTVISENKLLYPYTLERLHFDINSIDGRESADLFLNKLGSSYEELKKTTTPKSLLNFSQSDNLTLKARYWPNFYKEIEWRKPSSFKEAINEILKNAENGDFPDLLIDSLIAQERGIIAKIPPAKILLYLPKQAIPPPKPTLNIVSRKEEMERLRKEKEQKLLEEQILQESLLNLSKQEKITKKWQQLSLNTLYKHQREGIKLIAESLVEFRENEFLESYRLLKYFLKWKKNVKEIKAKREFLLYLNKYRNPQRVYHGINNPSIDFSKNKHFSNQNQKIRKAEVLNALNDREKQKNSSSQDFLDQLALSFLKRDNKNLREQYYKITIIADEQNSLIADMVSSLSQYLSQGKMKSEETIFQIQVEIEDLKVDYTLQLQMAKYLSQISYKELSGSDLFIYVLNEIDTEQNQTYFKQFKNLLKALFTHNLALGFNLLFISVSDNKPPIVVSNNGNEFLPSNIRMNSASFNNSIGGNLNLPISTQIKKNNSNMFGSQSQNMFASQFSNSNSVAYEQMMMIEMEYYNPQYQDSEGLVRRAIKYLNSKLSLKESIQESNSIIQNYHVVAYKYEWIGQKCVNLQPFHERIFKGAIDAAVEKTIKSKQPFEKVKLISLGNMFEQIKNILQLNDKENGQKLKDMLLKEEALFEEDKLNRKSNHKDKDMSSYYYFKRIFNECILQLVENTLQILEQSQLIPFDQLDNKEVQQLNVCLDGKQQLRTLLDKLFIRKQDSLIKNSIQGSFTSFYTYKNIIDVFQQYYTNILDIDNNYSDNQEALNILIEDMEEVIKNNIYVGKRTENGLVANYQAVFIKLCEQLQDIFNQNEVFLFTHTTFKFNLDIKKIKSLASKDTQSMNQWLSHLKRESQRYLQKDEYPAAPALVKKRKIEDPFFESVRIYQEIVSYDSTLYPLSSSQDSSNQGMDNLSKSSNHNSNGRKPERSNSPSNQNDSDNNSIDQSNSPQMDEEGVHKAPNLKKRRTACLVLNSKEEAMMNDNYAEKIKRLMRGDISFESPIKLDDSFV